MTEEKKIIQKQQIYFENLLDKINKTKNIEEKINLAIIASDYVTYNHTGYYYSTKLEKLFIDYAKSIKDELKNNYKPNTFLHVLTKAFTGGGHTRVVEKWIEQSPNNQTHSVICINQNKNQIPEKLKNAVKDKNGELILLNKDNLKDRAIELRKIASEYEYVILHTHMEDPTALVAFGTEDFKRPVIFYNHADHMFWLGKSVTDKLATLKEYADTLTIPKRNIKDSFMLGVPIESKTRQIIDKKIAKEKLNLDINKKLIISAGNPHKYTPMLGKSFVDYLLNIIKENDNIQIIIIGPSPKEKLWEQAYKKSNGIIKVIGQVDYNNGYFDYMNAADLVIDSWPMGGGTVMIDAISCKTPVLALKNPIGQFDYLAKSQAYCKTEGELYQKTKLILNNEDFRNNLVNEVKTNLEQDHSVENWGKKLEKLIEITPKTHTVKDISQEKENKEIDDAAICLNYIYNKEFKKNNKLKVFKYHMLYYINKFIFNNKKATYRYLKKYHMLNN